MLDMGRNVGSIVGTTPVTIASQRMNPWACLAAAASPPINEPTTTKSNGSTSANCLYLVPMKRPTLYNGFDPKLAMAAC